MNKCGTYEFPNIELLNRNSDQREDNKIEEKIKIENFFNTYGVDVDCKEIYNSVNSVTYCLDLKLKTRIKTIQNLKIEIQMYFDAVEIYFLPAINGTSYLGIQIIKNEKINIGLGELIESNEFQNINSEIPIILGKDYNDNLIIENLEDLPHLLVAGTTGTGKSTFLSTFMISTLYKKKPEDIKFICIDTRATNLTRFNGIPHLLIPVVIDIDKSLETLAWISQEMMNRYSLFSSVKVDNIKSYNEIEENKLPRIIVIIEDFGDLMLNASEEVEEYTRRIVQMSRAAGIHLIISTQRPSTNVLTGTIKANLPARIAFRVPAQIDSKTILDIAGAEKLINIGDILFMNIGHNNLKMIQTPFISDEEVRRIVGIVKEHNEENYNMDILEIIDKKNNYIEIDFEEDIEDPFLNEAIEEVINMGQASTSFIQRRFKVGYGRAGRIIDEMEEKGIISGYEGSKPREVLISKEEWDNQKKLN